MSLLRELQDLLTDPKFKVSDALRKAQILAYRLGNTELRDWVERELDGYPDSSDVPEYRITDVIPRGHFSGPFGSAINNADIPVLSLPENMRTIAEVFHFPHGIGTLESMVASKEAGNLRRPWPADFVQFIVNGEGGGIYQGYVCAQAWSEFPRSAVYRVIETVKNRLLKFTLEIEREYPDAGEMAPGSTPVPQEVVTNIFNTVIYGDASVANCSRDFNQS